MEKNSLKSPRFNAAYGTPYSGLEFHLQFFDYAVELMGSLQLKVNEKTPYTS